MAIWLDLWTLIFWWTKRVGLRCVCFACQEVYAPASRVVQVAIEMSSTVCKGSFLQEHALPGDLAWEQHHPRSLGCVARDTWQASNPFPLT